MKPNAHPISRVLAYLIDYLLVYNTAFMILHFGLEFDAWDAIRLSYVIAVFYNVLFILYFNGATVGKRVSKLQVVQEGLASPKLMNVIVREVAKTLVIIPYFGLIILIINIFLLVLRKRLIQDLLSETQVVFVTTNEDNI